MMIDSSIIVTENISQYRERGYSLRRACVTGTSEVVTPMLSSSLTTIAVFAPLIFMSGIAGAIFFDQAFSVTVGLMVSYLTGIMLLPCFICWFTGQVSAPGNGSGFLSNLITRSRITRWTASMMRVLTGYFAIKRSVYCSV